MNAKEVFAQVIPTFRTEKPSDRLASSSLSKREDAPEGRSVLVSTTIHAVEELRPVWKKWPHGFHTDVDYYLQSLKIDPTILHPHVLTVYQDGAPVAMLVGQVRKRRMSNVVSFVSFREQVLACVSLTWVTAVRNTTGVLGVRNRKRSQYMCTVPRCGACG